MRYDTWVTFCAETERYYDPDLGRWTDGVTTETQRLCHVHDLRMLKRLELFGDVTVNGLMVSTLHAVDGPISYVYVSGDLKKTKYDVVTVLNAGRDTAYILKERKT